jgi:aspartyl-tRNA synthetase
MNIDIPREDDNEHIEFKDAFPNVVEEPIEEPFRHPFAYSPPRDRSKRFRRNDIRHKRDFQRNRFESFNPYDSSHYNLPPPRDSPPYSPPYSPPSSNNDDFDYKRGCVICRTNFTENDDTFPLDCGHRFHTDEIRLWFKKNNTCPICSKIHPGTASEDSFTPLSGNAFGYGGFDNEENDDWGNDDELGNLYGYPIGGSDSFVFTDDEFQLTPSSEILPDPLTTNSFTTNILRDRNLDSVIEFNCRISSVRDQKKMTFLVLRYNTLHECVSISHKVQGLIFKKDLDSEEVNVLKTLTPESVIKVRGKLIKSPVEIKSAELTYRDREIHIEHIETVSLSEVLPIQIQDLNVHSDIHTHIDVGQDSRLNHRILDLRSDQKQAIFQLQSLLSQYMRSFLYDNGFMEIHTPKLISASSEGGSEVFKVDYFGTPAFLAQSPQFYKQMVINSNFPRIFEVGPVFRAEKSNTKRHLTEFTGFDIEMRIEENYEEILELFYELLATTFSTLYQKHSDLIYKATKIDSFSLELKKCILSYKDAVALLNRNRDDGEEIIGEYDDLSHAQEYKLGELVKKTFETDLFILDKFPMNIRPFYTMEDDMTVPSVDKKYSRSYDIIFRGQEVLSGAQRINDYNTLIKKAKEKGLSQEAIDSMSFYLDSFKYGSFPHGGGGFGLERLLGNFLGLDEIRMVSMFPRDPKRISP